MTRPEKVSKRKAFNKAIRERAAQEQTSFATVLQRTQDAQQKRAFRAMLNLPTHTARSERQRNMMKIQDQFHEPQAPTDEQFRDCGVCDTDSAEPPSKEVLIVELMAMAKPAKVKGLAKEYEVVNRVKGVIVLEDTVSDLDLDGDDWEEIGYEHDFKAKRSYSAALRGR